MSEGFTLPPDQLRAHADQLDGHAEALGQAVDAARGAHLGGTDYGVTCAFLPLKLSITGALTAATVGSAEQAIAALATALRDAVEDQEVQDAEIADALKRLIDELGW
ncbi:type VII secretion target [Saccharopolyspora sp. K220]|uniref:type VII secretion target n=1 Tax=Saccharopolyspora soli TaxID=2926618 RepID=UPI001F578E0C|nr:type VII secretion target [Saccharopolyspora soli]MCI2420546.1 type VII secretion target [Saccharopolyspora soli]